MKGLNSEAVKQVYRACRALKWIVPLACCISTTGLGCQGGQRGVQLKDSHGESQAVELGIPEPKRQLTRVQSLSGGSHNHCLPESVISVLADGSVYCSSKKKVHQECPPPFRHQGNIPVAQADSLINVLRDEVRLVSKTEEMCTGGWASIDFFDRENGLYYSVDTLCRSDEVLTESRRILRDIWAKVCAGNVGPSES